MPTGRIFQTEALPGARGVLVATVPVLLSGAMSIDGVAVLVRLDRIEQKLASLARRDGQRKRPRDGQRVLSIRAGDNRIARVHAAAQRRGCTLTAILNEAIDHVIGPSTAQLSDRPESS